MLCESARVCRIFVVNTLVNTTCLKADILDAVRTIHTTICVFFSPILFFVTRFHGFCVTRYVKFISVQSSSLGHVTRKKKRKKKLISSTITLG